MRPLAIIAIYADVCIDRTKHAAINTKEFAVENKSELTCIAATTVVVGLAARVSGFKAGYAFANNE
jgi:hypothetical protein